MMNSFSLNSQSYCQLYRLHHEHSQENPDEHIILTKHQQLTKTYTSSDIKGTIEGVCAASTADAVAGPTPFSVDKCAIASFRLGSAAKAFRDAVRTSSSLRFATKFSSRDLQNDAQSSTTSLVHSGRQKQYEQVCQLCRRPCPFLLLVHQLWTSIWMLKDAMVSALHKTVE